MWREIFELYTQERRCLQPAVQDGKWASLNLILVITSREPHSARLPIFTGALQTGNKVELDYHCLQLKQLLGLTASAFKISRV